MTVGTIVETLHNNGVDVELGLKLNATAAPTPETTELINQLAEQRDDVVNYLLSARFVPLGEIATLPWATSDAEKQFIIDAPRRILAVIQKGFSPLFALL